MIPLYQSFDPSQLFVSMVIPLMLQFQNFFANFVNLTSLHLSFCGLNGTFPESVFQILTLQTLYLSNNELLQGALPDAISNLTILSILDLSNCNFSGSIPNSGKSCSVGLFGHVIKQLQWTDSIIQHGQEFDPDIPFS